MAGTSSSADNHLMPFFPLLDMRSRRPVHFLSPRHAPLGCHPHHSDPVAAPMCSPCVTFRPSLVSVRGSHLFFFLHSAAGHCCLLGRGAAVCCSICVYLGPVFHLLQRWLVLQGSSPKPPPPACPQGWLVVRWCDRGGGAQRRLGIEGAGGGVGKVRTRWSDGMKAWGKESRSKGVGVFECQCHGNSDSRVVRGAHADNLIGLVVWWKHQCTFGV